MPVNEVIGGFIQHCIQAKLLDITEVIRADPSLRIDKTCPELRLLPDKLLDVSRQLSKKAWCLQPALVSVQLQSITSDSFHCFDCPLASEERCSDIKPSPTNDLPLGTTETMETMFYTRR